MSCQNSQAAIDLHTVKKIKAILVDDEESARDVLQNLLLRFCPEVELVAKCEHITQAVKFIESEQPDLVFLDIEMPNYAGYEIVNFFQQINFEIIFITAYDQYAVRAFEIAAIDYLLKPIDIDRLKNAIARVNLHRNVEHQSNRMSLLSNTLQSNQLKNIVITDKGFQQIIPIESIIAIEAQESYCCIHTAAQKFIASKNLKHFETVLDSLSQFIRVHKSWMVNTNFILNYSKSEFSISLKNGITAKLSKYKKAEFEQAIK